MSQSPSLVMLNLMTRSRFVKFLHCIDSISPLETIKDSLERHLETMRNPIHHIIFPSDLVFIDDF